MMTGAVKQPEAEMVKNDYLGCGEGANLYRLVSEGCTEEVAMSNNIAQIIQKSNISISVCCCRPLPFLLLVDRTFDLLN